MASTWSVLIVMPYFSQYPSSAGLYAIPDEAETVAEILGDHFAPLMPEPFELNELALLGEAADGRFHLIETYALAG